MCVERTCCFLLCILLTVSAHEVLEVLEGESVTLKITGHVDKNNLKALEWTYNTTPIMDYRREEYIYPSYKGRVEFDVDTFSLRLMNLVKSDSGLYTALKDVDGKPKETVAKYDISVLEHAETPTLTVVSNWSSSDSCNVTLKCTGLNVSLISSCNTTFCSLEGGSRFLSISLNNTTVSCNHSNPLSWNQTTMDLTTLCEWSRQERQNDSHSWMIGVISGFLVIIVLIIAVIVATIYWHQKCRGFSTQDGASCLMKGRKRQPVNTSTPPITYASVKHIQSPMPPSRRQPVITTTPPVTYASVKHVHTPVPPSTGESVNTPPSPVTYASVEHIQSHLSPMPPSWRKPINKTTPPIIYATVKNIQSPEPSSRSHK